MHIDVLEDETDEILVDPYVRGVPVVRLAEHRDAVGIDNVADIQLDPVVVPVLGIPAEGGNRRLLHGYPVLRKTLIMVHLRLHVLQSVHRVVAGVHEAGVARETVLLLQQKVAVVERFPGVDREHGVQSLCENGVGQTAVIDHRAEQLVRRRCGIVVRDAV